MGYELTIDLKGGSLEIEGDSMDELAQRIAEVDIKRLEGLIGEARNRGGGKAKAAGRTSAKSAKKKAATKKAGKKKSSSKKRSSSKGRT